MSSFDTIDQISTLIYQTVQNQLILVKAIIGTVFTRLSRKLSTFFCFELFKKENLSKSRDELTDTELIFSCWCLPVKQEILFEMSDDDSDNFITVDKPTEDKEEETIEDILSKKFAKYSRW